MENFVMDNAPRPLCAPALHWCLRRNPMYLLSAACVAIGARMLLVSPATSPAGEIGLVVGGGFALLLAGAAISWHKSALLTRWNPPEEGVTESWGGETWGGES